MLPQKMRRSDSPEDRVSKPQEPKTSGDLTFIIKETGDELRDRFGALLAQGLTPEEIQIMQGVAR